MPPRAEMEVDGEEPEEMQGVSGMNFDAVAPQPPPMGAHSPVSSSHPSMTLMISRL